MAFSFNWAGTNIAQINPNQSRQAYDDAKNIGQALAGYRRSEGAREYADMIRNGYDAQGRIAEIQAEIQRLENRNRELQGMQREQDVTDMKLRDEQARQARASYMSPKGDPSQAGPYDGMYAPNTLELLKMIQYSR